MEYEISRKPVIVQFEDQTSFTETYGFVGSQGHVFLEGQLLVPEGLKSDTLFVFMHPATTLNLMPFPKGLATAGQHVMCCGSRYAKNDTALIMEKVVIDLGEYIRYAKEKLNYKKIVLMGWSGGGSLTLFYQAQALNPTITKTPAGDPIAMHNAKLIPADLVVFIAAHIGRARILSEWIDPSVQNELNPEEREIELDNETLQILLEMRERVSQTIGSSGHGSKSASRKWQIKKYSRMFKKCAIAEGFGEHKFHNLRDTYATRRWAITGDILLVSKEIGHKSVKMTEKYTKFNLRRLMTDFPSIAHIIKIRLEKRIMDKGLNGLAINNLQLGPKTVKVDTDLVDTRQVYRE